MLALATHGAVSHERAVEQSVSGAVIRIDADPPLDDSEDRRFGLRACHRVSCLHPILSFS